MKVKSLVFILLTFLLTLNGLVHCVNQVEYTIYIDTDGSALLTIIHVSESSFSYIDENLTALVEEVENRTGRKMNARVEEINIVPQDTYLVVKYIVRWENFCKVENSRLIVGDVFQAEDFFSKLYGDGVVYLTCSPDYSFVDPVSPEPDEQDDAHQMLKWFKAEALLTQTVNVVFKRKTSFGILELLQQNVVPLFSLITAVSGFFILFHLFRRRRGIKKVSAEPMFPHPLLEMENDEEKVVRTLKNGGGALYQSQISERCGFSKAKTSQLLKFMERKGIVRRQKKGRGKIVTLIRKVGEK